MNRTSPIYTESNNCQDCYKCLRQCPVKAIKIADASASIIPGDCVYCGHCVQICPVGAKKVRNDLPGLIRTLNGGTRIIACLAPSYSSDFQGTEPGILRNALHRLGFFGVSETALGAEMVSAATAKWLSSQPQGIYISSCCTSVVQMVNRHYPHLAQNLVPVLSPMQAHAKFLKEMYGSDIRVAFFGPCIAKKSELEVCTGLTDFALTFTDLHTLLDGELPGWKISGNSKENPFIPWPAQKGSYFPIDGGMIANLKEKATLTETAYMSFSGVKNIKEVLNDIPQWKTREQIFLELLLCEGGCIKGPCSTNEASVAVKRQQTIVAVKNQALSKQGTFPVVPILYSHNYKEEQQTRQQFSEAEIGNALRASGKFTKTDELNCGGCGYDSCRDFALAMLSDKAERIMCVSYMRRVAQDKASVLLKKIPYGVVVVDENLKIIDANQKFAELAGDQVNELYQNMGSLDGANLAGILFFHKLFASVLRTGEEMIEHRVRGNGQFLHVSIITIQPYKIVCGIIQNMQDPEIRKDLVVNSVRQVIHQHMDAVQKIAYLLGENASYTESMLNSIVESVSAEHLNNNQSVAHHDQ